MTASERVPGRLTGPDEIEPDIVGERRRIHRAADRLAAVADRNGRRRRPPLQDVAQRRRDLHPRERTRQATRAYRSSTVSVRNRRPSTSLAVAKSCSNAHSAASLSAWDASPTRLSARWSLWDFAVLESSTVCPNVCATCIHPGVAPSERDHPTNP